MINSDVILTGVTGILGSHLLYELIKEKKQSSLSGKIIALVRNKRDKTAEDRVVSLFKPEIAPYFIQEIPLEELMSYIEIVDCDLTQIECINKKLAPLTQKAILIHAGASVNLSNEDFAENEILENNFKPTIGLLNGCHSFIEKFVYISSAFTSGHRFGEIKDEFHQSETFKFRNHYERYKFDAECEIIKFCIAHNIKWQLLRPSIIGGRLIDEPKFVIPRFVVFYMLGVFFQRIVTKYGNTEKIRMTVPENSNLNIVPVDYSAKAVIRAIQMDDIQEMNIVHSENVPIKQIISSMMETCGLSNFEMVTREPEDPSLIETMFQHYVGSQLAHYVETPNHYFNAKRVRRVLADFDEPNVMANFSGLVEYAREQRFADLIQ